MSGLRMATPGLVASLVAQSGLSTAGATGTAWQSAFLIGACLVAVWAVRVAVLGLVVVAVAAVATRHRAAMHAGSTRAEPNARVALDQVDASPVVFPGSQ